MASFSAGEVGHLSHLSVAYDTFLDPSVESQFRIISKSHNFHFGTTTTSSFTFSKIVTSSQVKVGTPFPLQLCCISGLGPEGLWHNHTIPVWSPGNLLRVTLASSGNSASENLQ